MITEAELELMYKKHQAESHAAALAAIYAAGQESARDDMAMSVVNAAIATQQQQPQENPQ